MISFYTSHIQVKSLMMATV